MADYTGEIFSLKGAYLQTRPRRSQGPGIYIGAIGKRNREMAGRIADGWFPMATETPETLSRKLLDVREGSGEIGPGHGGVRCTGHDLHGHLG